MNPYYQLAGLDLPTLQVLEAALALGGLVTEAEVSALVGADATPHLQRAADAELLARLRGRLAVNGILGEVFARPLGVGPPAGQLAAVSNVNELNRRSLRLPGARRIPRRCAATPRRAASPRSGCCRRCWTGPDVSHWPPSRPAAWAYAS